MDGKDRTEPILLGIIWALAEAMSSIIGEF